MLSWFVENGGTLAIGLVVLIVTFLAVRSLRKNKKKLAVVLAVMAVRADIASTKIGKNKENLSERVSVRFREVCSLELSLFQQEREQPQESY